MTRTDTAARPPTPRRPLVQRVAALALAAAAGLAAAAEPTMVLPQDLLKDRRFMDAYLAALGPKAKEPWLSRLSNSAPIREHRFDAVAYQVATPCKPHDCADTNLLLMYAPASGQVVGRLVERGRATTIGTPSAAVSAELDRQWKREFRQQ